MTEPKKLYKVKIGKPTGSGPSFISYVAYSESRIKSEYFVVAKSFNEAGKLVMAYVKQILDTGPTEIVNSPYGIDIQTYENVEVSSIELVSNETIYS
jgi:hypothetical protein